MSSPINKSISKDIISNLSNEFRSKQPYRYAEVGILFDYEELSQVASELEEYVKSLPAEKNIYGSYRKFRQSSIDLMPPLTKKLVTYLNCQEFIKILEDITGIDNLHGDPELLGGGIHAIGAGGFLKLHTDFNWHPSLKMHRRLNLLIYLNEKWEPEWKGAIELWDEKVSNRVFSLEPRLGNALLFETSDISYHGHPDPLEAPVGVYRKSIAMYYYTHSRPDSEVRLGKSNMTNYVERPGELFTKDRFRRFRHKLQLGFKRFLYTILRHF